MIMRMRWLATGSLVIFFSVAGCAIVASHDNEGDRSKTTTVLREVTGKIVRVTPCRTLIEIEVAAGGATGEATKIQFFCLDAGVRESAKSVGKGDMVKVRYAFSPETQRNCIRKITQVDPGA